MFKRFVLPVVMIVGVSFGQLPNPGRMPRWDSFLAYARGGMFTTLSTYGATTINNGTFKVVGNSTSNNLYVVSEGDSFKVRMYKYLYPLEIEIGNSTKFTVDSAGNAVFAGTVSASAFSPTASSDITAASVTAIADGDSVWINPYKNTYMIKAAVGGAKKFAVDSTGLVFGPNEGTISNVTNSQWILAENSEDLNFAFATNAVNVTSSTAVNNVNFGILDVKSDKFVSVADNDSIVVDAYKDLHLIDAQVAGVSMFNVDSTGAVDFVSLAGAVTVNGKITISGNYPLVSSSKITADSLTAPYVNGSTELKGKLTIAADYPLVSSSKVSMDSVQLTASNAWMTDVDTLKTAGGTVRALVFTVNGVKFYAAADSTKI